MYPYLHLYLPSNAKLDALYCQINRFQDWRGKGKIVPIYVDVIVARLSKSPFQYYFCLSLVLVSSLSWLRRRRRRQLMASLDCGLQCNYSIALNSIQNCMMQKIIGQCKLLKNTILLSAGQMRMRVDESSNSRSHLAWNSHALSATLVRSHRIWTWSNISWESSEFSLVWPKVMIVNKSWRNSHESQLSATLHPRLGPGFDVFLSLFVLLQGRGARWLGESNVSWYRRG